MRHKTQIYALAALISLAAVMALPGVGDAKKLTDRDVIKNLEYGYQSGYITSISPNGDYFTLKGKGKGKNKTIFITESSAGGEKLVTSFHGLEGQDITFQDLKPRDYVMVYGGALKDDTRAAKDVFVTSDKMTGKQMKEFKKKKKLKPWREGKKKHK